MEGQCRGKGCWGGLHQEHQCPAGAVARGWSFRAGIRIWYCWSFTALVSAWTSLGWRLPGCSLKCPNFWHLVSQVSFASRYWSEYLWGWKILVKYYMIFWKRHCSNEEGHNCRIQACPCAGQTVVPLMKHIFVVSFFSFICVYVQSLSPF